MKQLIIVILLILLISCSSEQIEDKNEKTYNVDVTDSRGNILNSYVSIGKINTMVFERGYYFTEYKTNKEITITLSKFNNVIVTEQ